MEPDSWSRFSAAVSRRHQSAFQSRYTDSNLRGWRDLCLEFEEVDGGGEDDSYRGEFSCPFCCEDFDIVGLCCHIDEVHPVEAKNGVCPVCAVRVGLDLVGHITMQHGNFFKMQRRRRFRKGSSSSHSMISLLRKDMREGNLQALFGGSSFLAPATSATHDPYLSSLIYTLPDGESSKDSKPEPLDETSLVIKNSDEKVLESKVEPQLSDQDQKERARRGEFMQGLVLSTIFNDPQ